MKTLPCRTRMRLPWVALAFAVLMSAVSRAEDATPPDTSSSEIRVREIYVPYKEFMGLVGKEPDATIMTLAEYRALVELATRQDLKHALTEREKKFLPPVTYALTEAVYRGEAQRVGSGENWTARFDATFSLTLTGDKWVRCALGPALPGLGKVEVDGEPGWVLVDQGIAYLLLKGRGHHKGTLSFTLPVKTQDEALELRGSLLKAPAARVELQVPGHAKAIGEGVDTQYDEATDHTLLARAVGGAQQFVLAWQRAFGAERNEALLRARHGIAYGLEPGAVSFVWQAQVVIARRKTDRLVFDEPPGGRVINLDGPLVHSWQARDGQIHLLLNKPMLGAVDMRGTGLVPSQNAGEAFTVALGVPSLVGARQESRELVLYHREGERMRITGSDGFTERAASEVWVPARPGAPASAFRQERTDARLNVRMASRPAVFDQQTAMSLRVDLKSVTLRAAVQLQLEKGRLYGARLSAPDGWSVLGIAERGTNHGLEAEKLLSADGEAESWWVRWTRGADDAKPVAFDVTMRLRERTWLDGDWSRHDLSLAAPAVSGARRDQTYLAVHVHPSIRIVNGRGQDAWRAVPAGVLQRLGIPEASLRVGLQTDRRDARFALSLERKTPRGEYEAVTHLLAQEREAFVRTDIRLAVVDRALDEILIELPPEAQDPLEVEGPGVKEVAPGDTPNTRRVRFAEPWLGVRMLRVGYRHAIAAETALPIPSIRVLGRFDGRRRLVFQSAGSVEMDVQPGAGLGEVTLGDTPAFAQPFRYGRALFAYTYQATGATGTYRIKIYESSDVLGSVVRELRIASVLDRSGVMRSHAGFLLFYKRHQYLHVALPEDATLLAVTVDGQRVKPVAFVQGQTVGARDVNVPLPPKTTAQVELVYERRPGALGWSGTWRERAPVLPGIPVARTAWDIHYPTDYLLQLKEGNLAGDAGTYDAAPAFFAASFFGRMIKGRWPRWTAWETLSTPAPVIWHDESVGGQAAPVQVATQRMQQQTLQARELKQQAPPPPRTIADWAVPEGAVLRAQKLGGNAELSAGYRHLRFARFAGRSVFLLALCLGFWLWKARGMAFAAKAALVALVVGTLLPPALGWESPSLAVPFCEGLSLLLVVLALSGLAARVFAKRRAPAAARMAATGLMLVLGFALNDGSREVIAAESDPVVIPYLPNEVDKLDESRDTRKVYVPKSIFLDLMKRAFPHYKPGEKLPPFTLPPGPEQKPDVPAPFAWGQAQYEMSVDLEAKTYRATGVVTLRTFHPERWVKIPLHGGGSQLVSATLDGEALQVAFENERPYIALQGARARTLKVELTGPLSFDAGRGALQAELIGGQAVRVKLALPADLELDLKSLPSGAWATREGDTATYDIQTGPQRMLALRWRAAKLGVQAASQVSARSYTHLLLQEDGYTVKRVERITIDGRGVDQFDWTILGGIEVSDVSARQLAEWQVLRPEGEAPRLRLTFHKPVNAVQIGISGWAPLGAEATPVGGFSLAGALRQSGFVGLKNGPWRRFTLDSLKDLKRSSWREVTADIALASDYAPDRIFRFHEPPQNHSLAAEDVAHDYALATDAVGVVLPDRLLANMRTRYTARAHAPLRHTVPLPDGWSVRTVTCKHLRHWEVTDLNGRPHLVVDFNQRMPQDGEIIWSAEQSYARIDAARTLAVPVPRALVGGKVQETFEWTLAADRALDLSEDAGTSMRSFPLDRATRWVDLGSAATYRFAYRSTKPDAVLNVSARRKGTLGHATAVQFVRVGPDYLLINARIRYHVEAAGVEQVSLTLPAGAELVGLEARNLRSLARSPDGEATRVDVLLQAPVLGEQTVDVALRMPRTPGEDLKVAGVALADAWLQRVEHFVGVLLIEQRQFTVVNTTGLTPLADFEKLPFLPDGVSAAALAHAFTADGSWVLTLRQPDLRVEVGQDAEISLAMIRTIISRTGTVRSVVTYTLRNRARQFLKLELPEGARLWGVLVDGRPATVNRAATAAAAGGVAQLLIPIHRLGAADLPMSVRVVYEHPPIELPAGLRTLSPRAPRVIDTPVLETNWQLYVPDEYEVMRTAGNMEEIPSIGLAGSKLQVNVKEAERLMIIADSETASYREKRQALRNLAQVQQSLSDNVIDMQRLEVANAVQDRARVDEAAYRKQQSFNGSVSKEALRWSGQLQSRGKDIEKALQETGDPQQLQAFQDRYRFLGNGWRGGERYQEKAVKQSAPGQTGVPLDALRHARPFAGFGAGGVGAAPRAAVQEDLAVLPATAGKLTDAARLAMIEAPAAEIEPPVDGKPYTFRLVENHPELTVTLRSARSTWRLSAQVALLLGIVIAFVLYRRRAKKV